LAQLFTSNLKPTFSKDLSLVKKGLLVIGKNCAVVILQQCLYIHCNIAIT